MPDITTAIASEIYTAVGRLTDDVDLLSILGSYQDTLSDEEVLGLLIEYNAGRPVINPIN